MTKRTLLYSNGVLTPYPKFVSNHIKPRQVDVWTPPGYENDSTKRYAVIYMHDGNNLFDPKYSFTKIDWGIDEALARLIEEGVTDGAIVVGIWNTRRRRREYMPEKMLLSPEAAPYAKQFARIHGGLPLSDGYLKFMVEELKPFIDATYRTLPDQAHTSIMGSSMGGLISLYALCEYPNIFGGAGCLSTHWSAGKMAMVEYMSHALPPSGQHKIYFDFGTETLDTEYEPYQQQMDLRMQAKGYQQGKDWLTRKFEGADHSEAAWRARVDIPLQFLLGKQ